MLQGLKIIKPKSHPDSRGFLAEIYHERRYQELGISCHFVQENHSYSKERVIRGMHFQKGQAKLITCVRGEILDVAVDIRPDSPTFGRYEAVVLSGDNHHQFFIPDGFAHGFCVISPEAHVIYKLSLPYNPEKEGGFRYDDPQVGIKWPILDPILSKRDCDAPLLKDLNL